MKLSIILTVYNKAPYLRRSLDCLLGQKDISLDCYEVIAVNDGSSDGSLQILEEYKEKSKRLKIINQRNQGLSVSRNNGIKAARGEYVWCVDADDTISSIAVKLIYMAILKCPDVVAIYARTEGLPEIRNKISPTANTGCDVLIERKWEDCGVFYIFKHKFLDDKNLYFVPNMFHEDAEFTPRVLYEAKSVVVIPEIVYNVYRTEGSITNVPNPKRAYDLLIVAEENEQTIEINRLWTTKVGRGLCYHGALCITNALHVIVQQDLLQQQLFSESLYKKRHLYKLFFYSRTPRYCLLGVLFLLFPKRSVWLYKFLNRV